MTSDGSSHELISHTLHPETGQIKSSAATEGSCQHKSAEYEAIAGN